ncbi:MAG: hypothetical protein WC546_05095 [Candidatus Omnitrophota bacterium]
MKLNSKKSDSLKAQSILEYLIVLAAIFVAIVINTVGFRTGVQNSLGLQNSLDTTQNTIETKVVRNPEPPQTVKEQPYYKQSSENVEDPAMSNSNVSQVDQYAGPEYTGGYDYDRWVRNNPNSADNALAAETVTPDDPVIPDAPDVPFE